MISPTVRGVLALTLLAGLAVGGVAIRSPAPAAAPAPKPEAPDVLTYSGRVLGPDGTPLPGDAHVGMDERTWQFTPKQAWTAGNYNLLAFAALEDLAGNRIGRAFEVDQFERTDSSAEPEKTLIPFTVR